jgi:hypothetical protein
MTRFLSALLAALMLAGTLSACATGDETPDDGKTTEATTEADTGLSDNLPSNLNFAGAEFTIISRDREGWTRGEVSVDGLNGDPVNDAIYERNKAVEQRLNFKLTSILDNNAGSDVVPNKVVQAVQAGTSDYDIMAACSYTTFPHTLTGNFANLANTEYIDLEQPWWTQGYNDAISYDSLQFTATGSLLLSIYRFAFVTVFNKDLFIDANQPFLYDTVENGEWTIEKQTSLVPLFYKENGDGVADDKDTYGFVSTSLISTDPYWSSLDLDIISKNGDGDLEYVLDTNKLHTATDKILDLFYGTDGGSRIIAPYGGDAEQDDIRNLFAQGHAAMATLRIMALENTIMRDMDNEYGVIPMPKYDAAQESYRTLLHDQFTVVSVPTTVKFERLDQVSAILEAMGSASYQIVKPVYYEETLRTKIANDPQSSLMMDIITEGIYIDLGIIYVDCGIQSGLRTMIDTKQNNTSSRYKAVAKVTKNRIKAMSVKLDNLVDAQE